MRAETRHQLKTDSFTKATIGAAEKTVHWSVEHKSKLIAGIVVVLVVAAAVLGGWFYLSQQDEKASVELGQAVRTMEAPLRPAGTPAAADSPSFTSAKERVTEAHKQFQSVVDKYPHTHSSDVARYFVGVTAADLGDNTAAERELKSVASSGNDDLAGLAQMSLASLYRNTNRSKDAIEIYKKLIDKPAQSVGKVRAQLELAATYESQQLPLEAKSIYQQVQKDNPSSPAAQIASEKIAALK